VRHHKKEGGGVSLTSEPAKAAIPLLYRRKEGRDGVRRKKDLGVTITSVENASRYADEEEPSLKVPREQLSQGGLPVRKEKVSLKKRDLLGNFKELL